jgi:hypothetical protein
MKTTLKISLIITLLTASLLCSGIVSALTLTPDQAVLRAIVSNPNPAAGTSITVSVFLQNNYTEALQLTYLGIHFGWMPTDTLYGFNLSSTPITVAAGSDYIFPQPINLNIPQNVNGAQDYYAGVDGIALTSQEPFSLNSATAQILVTGTGPTPSPTAAPTNTDNPDSQPDLLLYGVLIAVAVIAALLIVVLLMKNRRKQPKQTTEPTPTTSSEQKPSEQDFSI